LDELGATQLTCDTRDSDAAFSSSAADGVDAVGWLLACPAAGMPPRGGAACCALVADPEEEGLLLGANEVGADFAASAAALTASGATGAPPTCASIGEPPGRDAAATLPHTLSSCMCYRFRCMVSFTCCRVRALLTVRAANVVHRVSSIFVHTHQPPFCVNTARP
jgi:hypothetical protein